MKLAAQPAGNVTVALSISGSDPDGDISFAPSSLTFTAQNYATGQTVTVSAAADSDRRQTEAPQSRTPQPAAATTAYPKT